MNGAEILVGCALSRLRDVEPASCRCCVTSPPYWGLRDYGVDGQLGLESSVEEYVANMVLVFRLVREALADDGTLWLNLGDSYVGSRCGGQGQNGAMADRSHAAQRCRVIDKTMASPGLKPKDLVGIPWRVAFALQADGWWLRMDNVWHKPNPMPESVRDRPTKAHEYVFLLSKSARYFYDADAIKEQAVSDHDSGNGYARPEQLSKGGRGQDGRWTIEGSGGLRNARSVWTVATQPFPGAHFATMAPKLAERCVRAGSAKGDMVLDPFSGAGTTGLVARRLQRGLVGVELNPEYAAMAWRRIESDAPLFNRGRA